MSVPFEERFPSVSPRTQQVLAKALASQDQAAALVSAIESPRAGNGVVYGDNQYLGDNTHQGLEDFARIKAQQGTPLEASDFTLSAGWGSTASVDDVQSGSTDTKFRITVLSHGTGQEANPNITLTFKDGAFDTLPTVYACRGGGDQLAVPVVVIATSTENLTLTFVGTPVDGETYDVIGLVIE